MSRMCLPLFAAVFVVVVSACPPLDSAIPQNEEEVITTVTLTFTPSPDGEARVFSFSDPENDGDPVIDPIALLVADGEYDLAITFTNELADPPEDITEEVSDEGDDHQVLIAGDAVDGPATGTESGFITHAYNDTDGNGLPVGLRNRVFADGAGEGELRVILQHMPPENDAPVKDAAVAEDFAAGGAAAIGGSTDVDVTFPITVN